METQLSRNIDHCSDIIVQEVYNNHDNYYERSLNKKSNQCYIFFASNGLYFPNTEEEFIEQIINKNRFEWENISSDKFFEKKIGKIIFIRDVHKQWYVEGINSKLSSVEKLFEELKKITNGYEITTIGSSAGGYASCLFGCLLNAKRIITISGQFYFPETEINNNALLLKHKTDKNFSKFYDLYELLKNNHSEIFYIIPIRCTSDLNQYNHVKNLDNIFTIKINSENHGTGLISENYKYFFLMTSKKIKSKLFENRVYEQNEVFYLTVPFLDRVYIVIKKISFLFIKMIKTLLKKIGLFYILKDILKRKS